MTLIDCQTVSEVPDISDEQKSSWEAIMALWTVLEAARLGAQTSGSLPGAQLSGPALVTRPAVGIPDP